MNFVVAFERRIDGGQRVAIDQDIERFGCFFRGRFESRAGFHEARRDFHHAIVADQPDHSVR